MSLSRPPRLEIVDAGAVLPHEIADPGHERRIEERLRSDQVLRDPLLVGTVPDLSAYVLLDGTNRKLALAALDLPWVLVQIVDYADPHAVQLHTWYHATTMPREEIERGVEAVPGLRVSPLAPLEAPEALRASTSLAVLLDRRERRVIERLPEAHVARARQLHALVKLYEDQMARVDGDPDEVEEEARVLLGAPAGPATLVAFPAVTRAQVVAMATQGVHIPAGITRHIIASGRALRVNVPLALLREESLESANHGLTEHLERLHPRSYAEPTILFDS